MTPLRSAPSPPPPPPPGFSSTNQPLNPSTSPYAPPAGPLPPIPVAGRLFGGRRSRESERSGSRSDGSGARRSGDGCRSGGSLGESDSAGSRIATRMKIGRFVNKFPSPPSWGREKGMERLDG